MKKRICILISLMLICIAAFCGCGQEEQALDLRGTWSDLQDGSQMAVIDDDTITIYWGNEDASSLYWSGTYKAPTEATDKYSWESENYHDITDYELLASGDDIKTITYEGGYLTYEMSALGVTKIVKLSRSEIVGLNTRKSTGVQYDCVDLKLLDSGYSFHVGDDYGTVHYSVTIENPNKDVSVLSPSVKVTAKAANGSVLSTDETHLNYIAASDTVQYSNEIYWDGAEAPATVEFEVVTGKDFSPNIADHIKSSDIVFTNVSDRKSDYGSTITGEITNNSAIDSPCIMIIAAYYKDGKIVGGAYGFTEEIAAGKTTAFEIYGDDYVGQYDEVKLFGNDWL